MKSPFKPDESSTFTFKHVESIDADTINFKLQTNAPEAAIIFARATFDSTTMKWHVRFRSWFSTADRDFANLQAARLYIAAELCEYNHTIEVAIRNGKSNVIALKTAKDKGAQP